MKLVAACISLLGLAAGPAVASDLPVADGARLLAYRFQEGPQSGIGVTLRGASGPAFLWMTRVGAGEDGAPGGWVPLGLYPLDANGAGGARLHLAPEAAALAAGARHRAVFLRGSRPVTTTTTSTTSALEEPVGQELDFDWAMGGVPTRAGAVVSVAQPWSEFVSISATNADPSHPDEAVLVKWRAWIEGPVSPPPVGVGIGVPSPISGQDVGRMLAIAADVTDGDGDGRVDVPSVEPAGGVLTFDFAGPARVTFLTLFDVDEDGGKLRSFDGPTMLGEVDIPNEGDRSVQDVFVPGGFGRVTRLEVELAGSAAVVGMETIPCPAIINFDETATGVPLGLVAGEEVSGYDGLGLFSGWVTATNNDPTHPDVALLYDTGDPAAQDPDLATPGTGTGNTVAHHKALVVAEDVVDVDMDGVVDAPDDEKAGGVISFEWVTSDVFFESVTVIDVDDGEVSSVRVFDDSIHDWVEIPFADFGNNGVQTVASSIGPTRSIEVHFGGSAAVLELRICSDGD